MEIRVVERVGECYGRWEIYEMRMGNGEGEKKLLSPMLVKRLIPTWPIESYVWFD